MTAESSASATKNTEGKNTEGIFAARYRRLTFGLYMAIVASAFDQTAITAIMPTIAADFGDASRFGAAFVLPMSCSVVAMVAAGMLSDMRGAAIVVKFGLVVLGLGLGLSIIAWSMPIFLLSRALQGFGIGLLIVAVYAAIAQAYPVRLRTAVFAGFSAAFLVPSLVGPLFAGIITSIWSWHAVFAVTAGIVGVAFIFLHQPLRELPTAQRGWPRGAKPQLFAGLVIAVTLAGLSAVPDLETWQAIGATVVGAIVVGYALRPLVPAGFYRGSTVIARLVATRGAADMLIAAEIYLPLLLAQRDGYGPTLTGVGLSVSGVTWFLGSTLQARLADRVSFTRSLNLLQLSLIVGLTMIVGGLAMGLHAAVLISGWGVMSLGIGFVYPRLSSMPLELCDPRDTGATGSALQVTGQTSIAVMTALCAIVLSLGQTFAVHYAFMLVYGLFVVIPLPLIWLLWRNPPKLHQPV
ncbi:MFS transporter [Corynebacterium choanae]|uniref:Multidrug resistance protein 3 n=1 Tax=Corynebacterium choanae TaxID=1862358 RepID=A0A3G6J6V4_9CORY|nr:MFS transporter [Corynebacterium choanae]AZA13841.1 Multidrug resistance protein 3 [Corynebacterium choanae]